MSRRKQISVGNDAAGVGGFEIKSGQETTCTFTNSKNSGTLTLTKSVANDNGGLAVAGDFTLKANNVAFAQGVATPVDPGDYTLSETGPTAGYTASAWTCSGGSQNGATVTSRQVKASVAHSINDIAPSLTLTKVVHNDHGGTALASAWTLTAAGAKASPTNLSGSGGAASGTDFKADTYTLAETGGPSGYTASVWVCGGGTQNGDKTTVGLAQSATCTITSDLSCSVQVGSDETVDFVFDAPTGTSPSGHAQTATGVTVTTPNVYRWTAFFSGNTFNEAFTTACSSEPTDIKFQIQ